jgi:hypothetical protein
MHRQLLHSAHHVLVAQAGFGAPRSICCCASCHNCSTSDGALMFLLMHVCRGLDAQMPAMPNPAPMSSWRGQPLTHEAAESLFIGWKQQGPQMPQGDQATKPWSWLVAAGKNPAVSSVLGFCMAGEP